MIFSGDKDRIDINSVHAEVLQVLHVLADPTDRTAELSPRRYTAPFLLLSSAAKIPVFSGKAVGKNIIDDRILCPFGRCNNICAVIERQLIIFRAVIHGMIRESFSVVQHLFPAIGQCEIIAKSFIGMLQRSLPVIEFFRLRHHCHLLFCKKHRCQATGSVSVMKNAFCQIPSACPQTDQNMLFICPVCILGHGYM